jgi:hypothetical protein
MCVITAHGLAFVLLLVACLYQSTAFRAKVHRKDSVASQGQAADDFIPLPFQRKAAAKSKANVDAGQAKPITTELKAAGDGGMPVKEDKEVDTIATAGSPEKQKEFRDRMANARMRRREIVAFHEAGHAVAGAMIPDYDMVQKITIIPRTNGAGGLTFFSPSDDRLNTGLYSKQYLEGQLAVALGGRVAEEMIFGEVDATTGASNDLQQVGSIANRMVKEFGMSPVIGPIALQGPNGPQSPMERMMQGGDAGPTWGGQMMAQADMEVDRLVANAYARCRKILTENRDLLEILTTKLLEQETCTAEEFQLLIAKHGVYMAPYEIFDTPTADISLPFQELPGEQKIRALGGKADKMGPAPLQEGETTADAFR